MIDRVEIVAMARSWLGTPWIHQGRLKDVGVDCGGLIIGVGKKLDLLDFDTHAYGRIPDGQKLRALCDEHLTAKPVSDIVPGDVLLMRFSKLLRGRYGTEWAMPNHQSGEAVLLLDPATLTRVSGLDEVGIERLYRTVSIGSDPSLPDAIAFSNTAASLKP